MEARLLGQGDEAVLRAAALAVDAEQVVTQDRSRRLLADRGWVAVAALAPAPIGLAFGHVLRLLKGDSLLLYSMDVAEDHRRRGAARAMVERLKAFCVERDLFEMWVLTNRANIAAMRLYARSGGRDDQPDVAMFEWPTPGVEPGWN